jgi:CHAD domain-containing protein
LAAGTGLEFVADDGPGPVPERVSAALEPAYTVVQEATQRTRQVWLDTFDWRLHAAGLALRQVTAPPCAQLVLTSHAGEPLLAGALPRAIRWPGGLPVLPDGPLRDRLAPVLDVRALLPQARTMSVQTTLRVLDGELKTVARITVESAALAQPRTARPGTGQSGKGQPGAAPPRKTPPRTAHSRTAQPGTAPPATGPLPSRLLVVPVRGYIPAARRAAQLLATADGFTAASEPILATVLTAAGRTPGDYTGAVDVVLRPATPAREAVAAVLLQLAGTIEANVGYVLRDVDTEFLHDLRVAVRRTRSALKLAGDVLPAGTADRFAPEFKWLGDLTTPIRDLDVYLSGFGEMSARLHAAAPGDLEPFHGYLAARRAAERRKLARGLRSARFTELMADWRAALEKAAAPGPARVGRLRIANLAADRIAMAYQRVAKRGKAITTSADAAVPPADDVHALRKRGKELRYLLEFFGSLYEPAALRRAVKDLRALQDYLGDFQDAEVQRNVIREFAVWAVDRHGRETRARATRGASARRAGGELAGTLLALGELTGGLQVEQDRARAEVAGRFAGFARAGLLGTLGIPPRGGRS